MEAIASRLEAITTSNKTLLVTSASFRSRFMVLRSSFYQDACEPSCSEECQSARLELNSVEKRFEEQLLRQKKQAEKQRGSFLVASRLQLFCSFTV